MNLTKLKIQVSNTTLKYIIDGEIPLSILYNDLNPLEAEFKKLKQTAYVSEISRIEIFIYSSLFSLSPLKLPLQDALEVHQFLHTTSSNTTLKHLAVNDDKRLIFQYENSLLELCFLHFPNAIISNANAIFLNYIHKNFQNKGSCVCINIYDNELEICSWNGSEIDLYNNFLFTSKEDFIYYILYTYEKSKRNVLDDPLYITGDIFQNAAIHEFASRYIKNVNIGLSQSQNDARHELLVLS